MKKTLLFLGVFVAGTTFAQNTFTNANAPENGTYTLFVCDSSASDLANVTGANVTWDYSGISKIAGETKSIIFDSVSNTSFPAANISYDIDGLTTDFWNSSATERIREGLELISADLGGTVTFTFDTDKALLMTFPFDYEDAISDPFEGDITTSLGSFTGAGTHITKYDGYGTLKVGADVITNVSRIHYIDTINMVTPLGAMVVAMGQFEYYDLDNGTEPIFVHTSGTITQAGSSTPMMEYSIVVSKYEPTEIYVAPVSTKNITNVDFNLAPNPVKDELFVTGAFESANVQIIDQTGKVVYNGVASNGTVLSINNLENGIYVVKATVDNQTVTKKIVKL